MMKAGEVQHNRMILIVCRGLEEVPLLAGLPRTTDCRYVVASDDMRVHHEVGKYPWVAEVCWLEQMESFYQVAAAVITYLEVINRWLASLGDEQYGIPRELLFWIRHCEGGMTTQRIQDLLLLIRSALHLLAVYQPAGVIILRHPGREWEDAVLVQTARRQGIDARIMGGFRLPVVRGRLLSALKTVAREPFCMFSIMRTKLRHLGQRKRQKIYPQEIVLQLCSSEQKHVENIVPLMKALQDRGYDPVALLWRASAAADPIEREGLPAAALEDLVPVSSLWTATLRAGWTWLRARRKRQEFLTHPHLHYREISLGPLLWPSVSFFLIAEAANRYRLRQAAKKYFAAHFPKAIKLWGAGVLPEGSLVLRNLPDNPRPLIIDWWLGFFNNPYEHDLSSVDLYLAIGDAHRIYLEQQGVPPHRIMSTGSSRYDHLPAFRQDNSPEQSRSYLKIPLNFSSYLLFDPNATLRGFLSSQEQSSVTDALLEFAGEHPSMALLIKPHPSHRSGALEALIEYFSLPNVFLIDKNMLPYHAINATDLIITKFSTIALEAMLLERPVISIILDGEDRFSLYGEASENICDLNSLVELLTTLVSNSSIREEWTERRVEKQKVFVRYYFGDYRQAAADHGAQAIDHFIKGGVTTRRPVSYP